MANRVDKGEIFRDNAEGKVEKRTKGDKFRPRKGNRCDEIQVAHNAKYLAIHEAGTQNVSTTERKGSK